MVTKRFSRTLTTVALAASLTLVCFAGAGNLLAGDGPTHSRALTRAVRFSALHSESETPFEKFYHEFKSDVFCLDTYAVAKKIAFPLVGSEYFSGDGSEGNRWKNADDVKRHFTGLFSDNVRLVLFNVKPRGGQNDGSYYAFCLLPFWDPEDGQIYESAIIFEFATVGGQYKLVSIFAAG